METLHWGILHVCFISSQLNKPQIFPCSSAGKESACNAEAPVLSLGQEDPLEKGTVTHSSILAWRIPWIQTRNWPKIIKGMLGNEEWDDHLGLWKAPTCAWESRRRCTCAVQGRFPGEPEKALRSYSWLALQICESKDWRLRRYCKVP